MPAYLVRTIESLRLVGVFVARSPSDLYAIVDEGQNPSGCEYFKLQNDEGVFLDGQFTTEAEESGMLNEPDEDFFVYLRPVAEKDASKPELSETLARRLDKGRSWTSFSTKNFAEAFGLPVDNLIAEELA